MRYFKILSAKTWKRFITEETENAADF